MKRTELRLVFASPEAYTDQPIKICGWLRTSRNSKSVGFIELNDGTCFSNIQVVYEEEKLKDLSSEERLKERQVKVRPHVEAYFAWVRERLSDQKQLPKGKTAD